MKKLKPIISIIVPVYKVEKYLNRCLDSILAQTFQDWECLLIDDGSPDSSGLICDKYAELDTRFSVFHKSNGGVSSARNQGLDMASGSWVTFVDADDFVSPNYLGNLYAPVSLDASIDFVNGSGTYFHNGHRVRKIEELEDSVSEDVVKLFSFFKGYICGRLFKRAIIEKSCDGYPLRFDPTIRFSEDKLFMMMYITLVKRYAVSSEAGYFYNRDNESSATHRIRLSYSESVYNFKLKYNCITTFVSEHHLEEMSIKKQFVSLSRTLYPILCSIGRRQCRISEKISALQMDLDKDSLRILKYVPAPPLTRYVLHLFMAGRYRSAFILLRISELEILVVNKGKRLLHR